MTSSIWDSVILFSLPTYLHLAEGLWQMPHVKPGRFALERFPSKEIHVTLQSAVRGETCLVLGSITPPDEQLLTTLLLCHTLKKEGAAEIVTLLPYCAYMRQDKNESNKSLATAWVGAALNASGVKKVLTVDIHSQLALDAIPIPVTSLSPATLFAKEIVECSLYEATIVAPDEGAIARCEAVRQAAGVTRPVASFQKRRTPEGIRSTLQGETGPQVVIIDDILDTGGTLIACCEALQQARTEEIVIMVTHGLFTGTSWQRLWNLGVQRLYCTDTVPVPETLHSEQLRLLSVQPVLVQWLANAIR
jgi:ribose-phosphate pyrophosphokinase